MMRKFINSKYISKNSELFSHTIVKMVNILMINITCIISDFQKLVSNAYY